MTETECPALPESLFAGSDAPGYAGASRRASAKNDDRGESSGGGYAVSFGAVVATALSCALAGGVAGYFIPKKHQSRSAAWRYESVAGESDRPTETEFRNLSPRSRASGERAREVELSA
jgi:hypothetical protein